MARRSRARNMARLLGSGSALTTSADGRVELSSGVSSGGSGSGFSALNVTDGTVSSDTTVSSTQSALAVGPTEIGDGVTVTISSGGRTLIL